MKILIDTHIFLWAAEKSDKLSDTANEKIISGHNEIYISTVSFWEISIKYGLGKIELGDAKPEDLIPAAEKMRIEILPLDPFVSAESYKIKLKDSHKDPFDRMLINQAISNDLYILTDDRHFAQYSVEGLKLA
jgi:PIN domain nuclease of toxin-antitoxin system